MQTLRLTQTIQKGGCAAKVAARELQKILADLRMPPAHAELMVDGRHFDDAAIYRVDEGLALVQTVDFFTPIVDQPYEFGAVAAANALSDVYAMGGRPRTALGILAFPLASMPSTVATEVLQGACDVLRQAKACLVGGHSIDDDTIKFGLAVTGYVHPAKIWSNQGAQPGDALILTKALGTGTLAAALKRDLIDAAAMAPAIASMRTLNNVVDYLPEHLMQAVHAATDITGFGLSGHSLNLARASQVTMAIDFASLPLLPGAAESLRLERLTKAHRTNREYTEKDSKISGLTSWQELLLHDPQTSGGLLLSVSPASAKEMLEHLRPHFPLAQQIGEVRPKQATHLEIS